MEEQRKKRYWYELRKPLICEGCGRQLWSKNFYRKLVAKGRPGPRKWAPVGTFRGKPRNELVGTSVSFVPLDCVCGRAHTVRVLWVPRSFGVRYSPMEGFQIGIHESEEEAFARVIALRMREDARKRGEPVPEELREEPQEMTEEDAARVRANVARMRALLGQ